MRTSRTLAAAVLLLALLAGPLSAAGAKGRSPGKPPKAKPEPVALLSHAWSLVLGMWQKAGCVIDPSGRCVTAPAPLNSVDAGCGIDPSGRCHS